MSEMSESSSFVTEAELKATLRQRLLEKPLRHSDVTVLIPTLGRPILASSLAAMIRGTVWPGQLIVVDQGQRDQIGDWLRLVDSHGLPAEHIPSAQLGRAAGLNRGLERVETKFVLVTDDDCLVEKDWIKNMVSRLEDSPHCIVSGSVGATGEEAVSITVDRGQEKIQRRPGLTFDVMCGGNMGTSMEVVRCVGLFDEADYLATAEDCDWSYRALKSGIPIIHAPEIRVLHYGWRDEKERDAQLASYARSHGGFYGKHLRQGDLFILLRVAFHYLRALRRWSNGILTGDPERTRIGRAYLTGLMPGIMSGWRGAKSLR
jgi:glycosyltransferase involved in cell wall biosynthesis